MFHNVSIYTNNFCFGYINVSRFFETFTGVAGWLHYLLWDLICPYFGPLLHFFGPFWVIFLVLWGYFWGRGQVQKILEPTNVDFQVLFWKYSPIFLFLIQPNFGSFCHFLPFLGLGGLLLGSGSGSKTFLGPTYID